MKKTLLCLCLFSSAAYANQCKIIDTELAASYSEMKTYGSYNENNEEKYQSSEKHFKEALAKIEKLEGKFCAWEKAPKAGGLACSLQKIKNCKSLLGIGNLAGQCTNMAAFGVISYLMALGKRKLMS